MLLPQTIDECDFVLPGGKPKKQTHTHTRMQTFQHTLQFSLWPTWQPFRPPPKCFDFTASLRGAYIDKVLFNNESTVLKMFSVRLSHIDCVSAWRIDKPDCSPVREKYESTFFLPFGYWRDQAETFWEILNVFFFPLTTSHTHKYDKGGVVWIVYPHCKNADMQSTVPFWISKRVASVFVNDQAVL